MQTGSSSPAVLDRVETAVHRLAPTPIAFVLIVTGGVVDRYRRLRKERDHGAVSIETAIIVAVLIVAAVSIAAVIYAMYKKYQKDLDESDTKYEKPVPNS
ncbi:FeoB-associated Cys-rich membrane protein [Embleya sp. NPDC005575]|uniref:FeoB-associated Cys-rich membrane protein n=1 Tax=Embleya sp. NPDC005575 TaxID=3156892 RepID=UPI0033AC7544